MKILFTILIAAAVVVIGAIGFALSGLYDVSASSPHGGVVNWLLTTTSHASIERHSSDIDVPDLSDVSLASAGASDFNAMCSGCHGAPGKKPEAMGQGLNPAAPDLAKSAAHLTPAEIFWVTKYGIKMTGMPAWGASHDDDALWPVVAFVRTLPDLDADSYNAILAKAGGMGHHAADDGNGGDEHSENGHAEPAAEKVQKPHDDGHTHEH